MNIFAGHEVLVGSLAGIVCGLMMFATVLGVRISNQYANGWKSVVSLLACMVAVFFDLFALVFVFMLSSVLVLKDSGVVSLYGPIFCLLFFWCPLAIYRHYERNRHYSPKKSRRLWCSDKG